MKSMTIKKPLLKEGGRATKRPFLKKGGIVVHIQRDTDREISKPWLWTSNDVQIDEIKKGYPLRRFDELQEGFGVNRGVLATIAGLSTVTIHRRKKQGRFTPGESNSIYRLGRLYETALEVLESEENIKTWFNTKQIVFGGKTPLEYADTFPGSEEVEKVLRRMDQGVTL